MILLIRLAKETLVDHELMQSDLGAGHGLAAGSSATVDVSAHGQDSAVNSEPSIHMLQVASMPAMGTSAAMADDDGLNYLFEDSEDDSAASSDEDAANGTGNPKTKKRKSAGPSKNPRPATPQPTGAFSIQELTILNDFRDYCQRERGMSHHDFNEQIQSNARDVKNLKPFWDEIIALVPNRNRQAVQKFCRRRFHNYGKRGSWTLKEDRALCKAFDEHGKAWKKVAKAISRHPEDCRDRWRNRLKKQGQRSTEGWTLTEATQLCYLIGQCIWKYVTQKNAAIITKCINSGARYSTLPLLDFATLPPTNLEIWHEVDEKFPTRTRLQCNYKFKQLIDAGYTSVPMVITAAKATAYKQAEHKVAMHAKLGDRFNLVKALTSLPFHQESLIEWHMIAIRHPWRESWTDLDLQCMWADIKREFQQPEQLDHTYLAVADFCARQLLNRMPLEGFKYWNPLTEPEDRNFVPQLSTADLIVLLPPQPRNTKRRKTKVIAATDDISTSAPAINAAPTSTLTSTSTPASTFASSISEGMAAFNQAPMASAMHHQYNPLLDPMLQSPYTLHMAPLARLAPMTRMTRMAPHTFQAPIAPMMSGALQAPVSAAASASVAATAMMPSRLPIPIEDEDMDTDDGEEEYEALQRRENAADREELSDAMLARMLQDA